MANPQPDKFTRISNELYEAIMLTDFSKRQRNILDLVIRMSYGCGKKWALLRPSDFHVVGVHKSDIRAELNYLARAKVLFVDGERIVLNKDYEQWRISLVRLADRSAVDKILRRNLVNEQVGKTPTGVGEIPTNEESEEDRELAKHQPPSWQNTNSPVGEIPTENAENDPSTCCGGEPKESIKESFKESFREPAPPDKTETTLEEKFPRYTKMQWTAIRDYWGLIASTRQTGAVANSIVEREMHYWERFPPETVIEALKIHLRRYHTKREDYTRGIMRRIATDQRGSLRPRPEEVNWDDEPAAI